MIRPVPHDDTAEHSVADLFERVLAGLPDGSATLTTESNPKAPGPSIAVVPANPRSAEFGAVIGPDGLYSVFFGRGKTFSTFECPWEIGLPRSAKLDQQLEVLSKMFAAVIAGRCEHRVKRFSTRGAIFVSSDDIYRVGDLFLLASLKPQRNLGMVRYEPYFERGSSSLALS